MERDRLIRTILTIECRFPVDLTEEYLRALSIDRLRHIYVALRQHEKGSGKSDSTQQPPAS